MSRRKRAWKRQYSARAVQPYSDSTSNGDPTVLRASNTQSSVVREGTVASPSKSKPRSPNEGGLPLEILTADNSTQQASQKKSSSRRQRRKKRLSSTEQRLTESRAKPDQDRGTERKASNEVLREIAKQSGQASRSQENRTSAEDGTSQENSISQEARFAVHALTDNAILSEEQDIQSTSVQLGRKRKATNNLPAERAAQRAKSIEEGVFMDSEYIRQNFELPTDDKYPKHVKKIFVRLTRNGVVATLKLLDNGALNIREEFITTDIIRCGNPTFQCTIHYTGPDFEPLRTTGEGTTKRGALEAAGLRLLADLHSSQLLMQLLGSDMEANQAKADEVEAEKANAEGADPGKAKTEQLEVEKAEVIEAKFDKATAARVGVSKVKPERADAAKTRIAKAKAAKAEAAKARIAKAEAAKAKSAEAKAEKSMNTLERNDLELDELDTETERIEKDAVTDVYNYAARFACIPEILVRNVSAHRSKRPVVEVTIELKEQKLKSTGWAKTRRHAELAASIKFKSAAEQYHAEHGDESIVIKDSAALNTGNMTNFFEFYKREHKHDQIRIESLKSDRKPNYHGSLWESKTFLNDKLLAAPVYGSGPRNAEMLARLVAAVTLVQKEPQLLDAFRHALSHSVASGSSGILPPVGPITMALGEGSLFCMEDTLDAVKEMGLPDIPKESDTGMDPKADANRFRGRRLLDESEKSQRNEALREKQAAIRADPELKDILKVRASLPMSQYRDQVLELIKENSYCIVMGATGSGKTTQVPQIILEDAIAQGHGASCDIVCTQPRRIAAMSIAKRVGFERGESKNETVGFHVRFRAKPAGPGGSINYLTTGVLLQQLQHSPDETLDAISHIIIDEVHERDIPIDFLLLLIKNAVRQRRLVGKSSPKVILMSATIDERLFAKYFEEQTPDGVIIPCPAISVPGRTFPVEERYLETLMTELQSAYGIGTLSNKQADPDTLDYIQSEKDFMSRAQSNTSSDSDGSTAAIDWKSEVSQNADGQLVEDRTDALVPISLIGITIAHIAKTSSDGAILAFLPGYDEIKNVRDFLCGSTLLGIDFNDQARFRLFALHSSIPAEEQQAALDPLPEGCRKIILSTNIAETSVTIPDVKYIVDTGKIREKRYDQLRRITKLQCTWVSKSNSKQRAGRAGRVRDGHYYALFSRARFESLRSIGLPEMLRSDLQEVCLDVKSQAFNIPIREFFAQLIEPPSPPAVDKAVLDLVALEALTESEDMTPLGRLLADLPIHPSLGKVILLGVIFRCLDPILILSAAMAERSPFVSPPDRRKEIQEQQRRFLEDTSSDHIAIVNAVRETRTIGYTRGPLAAQEFMNRFSVHGGAFKFIMKTAEEIEGILIDRGIIPYTPARNKFEGEFGHPTLNKNANNNTLLRALILAGLHPNIGIGKSSTLRTPGERDALIHPGSLNYARKAGLQLTRGSLWTFTTLQKSNDGNSMLMRETTKVTPLMTILFGGKLSSEANVITVDGWIPFFVKAYGAITTGSALRTVTKFRQTFNHILSSTYAAIKPRRGENSSQAGNPTYLADNAAHEAFAAGVIDVLDQDAKFVQPEPDSHRPADSLAQVDPHKQADSHRPADLYKPADSYRSLRL